METLNKKEFVDELRTEWKSLWRNRIDDKVRAEGISNQDYSRLFVEQGTVIVATRDFKPPDFVEILQKHISSDAERLVPNPVVGGWGKFIRNAISKKKRLSRRRDLFEPKRNRGQQTKKGGRGWLHFRMK